MRKWEIRKLKNGYKLISSDTDSGEYEIKHYQSLAHAFEYIEKTALENKGEKELSEAQKKFAAAFPDKVIDCEIPEYIIGEHEKKIYVDIDELIKALKETSEWYRSQSNITLKSYIKYYEKIITGGYKDFKKSESNTNADFVKRCYTPEQLQKMFTRTEEEWEA